MTKTNKLPDVAECIEYVKGLNYALIGRGRGFYRSGNAVLVRDEKS